MLNNNKQEERDTERLMKIKRSLENKKTADKTTEKNLKYR